MLWLRILGITALAGGVFPAGAGSPAELAPGVQLPPVLRSSEPADSRVITLPGVPSPPAPERTPAPRPLAFVPPPRFQPRAQPKPLPLPPVVATAPLPPLPASLAGSPKPILPEDFTRESALFCHRKIGLWTVAEARALLGEPRRSRPAFDDDGHTMNGRIYAFADPSRRYREFELDFAGSADHPGRLRTVFVYPWDMTWSQCRRIWSGSVNSTQANKGRKFYSYLNQRLDVLVDPDGKVISLGLY